MHGISIPKPLLMKYGWIQMDEKPGLAPTQNAKPFQHEPRPNGELAHS